MDRPHSNHYRNKVSRVAALSLLLLAGAGLYATKKKNQATAAVDEHRRVLNALDRLTFGLRPGDAQTVAAMGVDKWIELQLHPEKIANGAMQARLAGYRTLAMSSKEMLLEFPPRPVAKAVIDGKLPMPRDPYRHAIYVAAIDRIGQQQAKKQNEVGSKANVEVVQASAVTPSKTANARELSQRPQEREAHGIVDQLAALPPDARMQRILSLPVAEQHDLTRGLPFEKRQTLLAGLNPEQHETVMALNNPEAVINSEIQSCQAAARGLQRPPTRRSAHRLLVQPLQRLHRQRRRPLPGHVVRARRDSSACAGQVQRPADRHGREPGDAVLSRQLAERGSGLGCGARSSRTRIRIRGHER